MGSRHFERGRWSAVAENDEDPKFDGGSLKGGVVVMDKGYQETWKERSTFRSQRECASRARTWNSMGSRQGVQDVRRQSEELQEQQTHRESQERS